MNMDPAGSISVRLVWDGEKIRQVEVTPRLALEAVKLLRGKTGQQAVNLIPLLFSLCGKAQGVAGAMALEAAQAIAPPPATANWRARLVLSEAIQESLWRLLLDVPKMAGLAPMVAEFATLRRLFARVLAPVWSQDGWKTAGGTIAAPDESAWQGLLMEAENFFAALLGMPLQDWRSLASIQDLERWLDSAATPLSASLRELWHGDNHWGSGSTGFLPPLKRDEMLGRVVPELEANPEFGVLPHWHGAAAETGALARMVQHPMVSALMQREGASIMTRLLARLLEVSELLLRLRDGRVAPSWLECTSVRPATGVAWVQTARGLLIHWLRLEDGLIADYRIVAPTEWNFHPAGAYVHVLTGRVAHSGHAARNDAERLLIALDPCVAYTLELNHA